MASIRRPINGVSQVELGDKIIGTLRVADGKVIALSPDESVNKEFATKRLAVMALVKHYRGSK